MRVVTETWWSEALGRQKSVSVVLPPGYTATGRPFPVLYLLHSYGGNRTTWLTCPSLADCAAAHRMILVLPESGRYWLINDAGGRRYEDYFVHEVVGQVEKRYNTVASRAGRAVAGFSMGGATALFHTLRHPDLFAVAGSHGGAFEAPLREGDPYASHRADQRMMMLHHPGGSRPDPRPREGDARVRTSQPCFAVGVLPTRPATVVCCTAATS
ncbi:alpha/beta hydrolase, partial [Streptomyces olivaceus]